MAGVPTPCSGFGPVGWPRVHRSLNRWFEVWSRVSYNMRPQLGLVGPGLWLASYYRGSQEKVCSQLLLVCTDYDVLYGVHNKEVNRKPRLVVWRASRDEAWATRLPGQEANKNTRMYFVSRLCPNRHNGWKARRGTSGINQTKHAAHKAFKCACGFVPEREWGYIQLVDHWTTREHKLCSVGTADQPPGGYQENVHKACWWQAKIGTTRRENRFGFWRLHNACSAGNLMAGHVAHTQMRGTPGREPSVSTIRTRPIVQC